MKRSWHGWQPKYLSAWLTTRCTKSCSSCCAGIQITVVAAVPAPAAVAVPVAEATPDDDAAAAVDVVVAGVLERWQCWQPGKAELRLL